MTFKSVYGPYTILELYQGTPSNVATLAVVKFVICTVFRNGGCCEPDLCEVGK